MQVTIPACFETTLYIPETMHAQFFTAGENAK